MVCSILGASRSFENTYRAMLRKLPILDVS